MSLLVVASAFTVLSLVLVFSLWVGAHAAKTFAEALTAAHQARYTAVQTRVAEAADDALAEAAEKKAPARAQYVPPSDDELTTAIMAERKAQQRRFEESKREYSTLGNEGFEDSAPTGGAVYNTAGLE